MSHSSYKNISQIGNNGYDPVNNPLTYCIGNSVDNMFAHGAGASRYGANSKHCQAFMSEYCAIGWDKFCEVASKDATTHYTPYEYGAKHGLTAGENLIRTTALRKWLVHMDGCEKVYEPFDPLVAASPLINRWIPISCCEQMKNKQSTVKKSATGCNSYCTPTYSVNPQIIDDDILMDKALEKPVIVIDILINIFNTMTNIGNINQLVGTKIGYFFGTNQYFTSRGYPIAEKIRFSGVNKI
jgi:hypothetical protein